MWDDTPNVIAVEQENLDSNYSLESGAEALEASIAAVSKYSGASAGFRTLLDALIPASAVLQEVNNNYFFSTFSVHVALSFDTNLVTFMSRG